MDKEVTDYLKNGQIKDALILMKKWKLPLKSDSLPEKSIYRLLVALQIRFEDISNDSSLLKATVTIIVGLHKSLNRSSKIKCNPNIYKLLCNFLFKCERKGYFNETLQMLRCCLNEIEEHLRISEGTVDNDLLFAYTRIYMTVMCLANTISRAKQADAAPSHVFRTRLLALVLAARSKISSSEFSNYFEGILGTQRVGKVSGEKDLSIIEEVILDFVRRTDVSYVDVVRTCMNYITWITNKHSHSEIKSMLKRITGFLLQLQSSMEVKQTEHSVDKAFCFSVVGALLNLTDGLGHGSQKFKKSPVEIFLSSQDGAEEKENLCAVTHSESLIDFIMDIDSQKTFEEDINFDVCKTFTPSKLERYLNSLSSMCKNFGSSVLKEVLVTLTDFIVDILETSPSKTLTGLLFKLYSFALSILVEEISVNKMSGKEDAVIFHWKRKLSTYLEMMSDEDGFTLDNTVEKEALSMMSVISSPSFQTDLKNILNIMLEYYKIGKKHYSIGNYKESENWFGCCLNLYKLRDFPKGDDKFSFKVWPCYEYLADSLRKLSRYEEALESVAEGLFKDPSSVVSACLRWLKIISDMVTRGSCQKSLTLASTVKAHLSKGSELTHKAILLEEFQTIKNSREKSLIQSYHEVVIEELLDSDELDDFERCEILLEKAKWVRSLHKDATAESLKVCSEVVTLLDSCRDVDPVRVKDLKAQTMVLTFVCAEPSTTEEMDLERQLKKLESLRFSEDNTSSNEKNKTSNAAEAEELRAKLESSGATSISLGLLELALELWCEIFSKPNGAICSIWSNNSINLPLTMESIEIMASLLRLHQHPKQIVAFQLLYLISARLSDTTNILWCPSFVADHFLELGQLEVASNVLSKMEECVSKLTPGDVEKNLFAYVHFMTTWCQVYFAQENFEEGATLLKKVGRSSETSNKVQEILARHRLYVTLSKYCLIQSKKEVKDSLMSLVILNDSTLKRGNCGTQLEWLVKASKCLLTVLPNIFGQKNRVNDCKPSLKYLLVDELIQTLLVTARCFIRCGIAREAKSYLLHAMAYSQAFHLQKRVCEAKLECANLDMLSGATDDSNYLLSSAELLLNDHSDLPSVPEAVAIRKSAREADVPSTPANYKISSKSLHLNLEDVPATPLSTWKKSPEQCKFPPCWSDLRQFKLPMETASKVKATKSRGRPSKKEVTFDVRQKCKTCDDVIVRRLQLWRMIASCELKLASEKQWQYVAGFIENVEEVMNNLVEWGKRELYRSNTSGDLEDAFGLESAEGLFCGKRLFENLVDKIEILKIQCSWVKNEIIKAEDHVLQNVVSLGPNHLISPTAIELLLWKLVSHIQWPSRLGQYLSELDLLKAQTGRIVTDCNQTLAASSPNSRNPKDSFASPAPFNDQGLSVINAPVKKVRRPKQLKLELARSTADTPVKRKPPARIKDLDLAWLEDFDKMISIEPRNGIDNGRLKDILKQLLNLMKDDPPAILYRELCHSLAIIALKEDTGNDSKAGFYFCEALSVSLRHATLLNVGRKIRCSDSALGGDSSASSGDLSRVMERLRKVAEFRGPKDWSDMIDDLPEEWTICQFNLVSLPGQDRSQLFVTRMQKNSPPLVVPFPHMTNSERRHLLEKWDWLMKENINSMTITERKDWLQRRKKLDEDVKEWMEEFEKTWFSGFVGALMGRLLNKEDEKNMKKAVETFLKDCPVVSDRKRRMVELLLSASHLLDKRCMIQALAFMADRPTDCNQLKQFIPLIQSISKRFNLELATRGPVILVLDKDFQHLPLENLPSLERQYFTRHISFHCLMGQFYSLRDNCSVVEFGVDKRNTYYVLDPDNNLENTQARFHDWFGKEPGWEGVVGRPPTSNELSKNLSLRDLYIYCGHGSGAKYLKGDDLQKLVCRSTVMLVGCSSGRLWSHGQFEPTGMLVYYFLANSPCVLAMLWDVTDRDIDRYVTNLLENWSPRSSSLDRDLLFNVIESRKACSFRHLIGAAPVVYGFPVVLKESK